MPQYQVQQNPTTGNWELHLNGQLISTGTQSAIQAMANNQVPVPTGGSTSTSSSSPSTLSSQGVQQNILNPIQQAITPPSTTPTTPLTPEQTLLQNEANAARTEAERRIAESNAYWDSLKPGFSAQRQAQVDIIKGQYAQLRQKQEIANKRRERLQETIGVRFGGRYAIGHTADLVQEQVDIGIQKIGELNNEENAAIAKIDAFFQDKEYTLAVKQYDELVEIRKARDKQLDEIAKRQVEGLKKIQEENTKLTNETNISEAFDQGIDTAPEIQKYLKEKGITLDLEEIDKTLKILKPDQKTVDALAGTTPDYKTFKKQQEEGTVPKDWTYLEYRNAVENINNKPTVPKVDVLTLAERKKSYPTLPLSLVGKPEQEVLAQLESSNPPQWFKELIQQQQQISLTPQALQTEWEKFRKGVLGAVTTTSKNTPSGLNEEPLY